MSDYLRKKMALKNTIAKGLIKEAKEKSYYKVLTEDNSNPNLAATKILNDFLKTTELDNDDIIEILDNAELKLYIEFAEDRSDTKEEKMIKEGTIENFLKAYDYVKNKLKK